MNKLTVLEGITGGAIGLFAYMAGLNWQLIIIWALIVVADVITGLMKGYILEWNSHKFKAGMLKKAYEAVVVFVLLLFDEALTLMSIGVNLGSIIIGAFILVDVFSIVENGNALGFKFAKVITVWLNKVRLLINGTLDEDDSEGE